MGTHLHSLLSLQPSCEEGGVPSAFLRERRRVMKSNPLPSEPGVSKEEAQPRLSACSSLAVPGGPQVPHLGSCLDSISSLPTQGPVGSGAPGGWRASRPPAVRSDRTLRPGKPALNPQPHALSGGSGRIPGGGPYSPTPEVWDSTGSTMGRSGNKASILLTDSGRRWSSGHTPDHES